METIEKSVSETEVQKKPSGKLPRPIYLITKRGQKIVRQAVTPTEYEKFYFKTPEDRSSYRSKDVFLPVSVDKEHPNVTTVQELWQILTESYGYQYM